MTAKKPLSDIPKRVSSRARSYADIPGGLPLNQALSDLSIEQKQTMLRTPEKFREMFTERGTPAIMADHLCALSRTMGYYALTECPGSLSQASLETFLDTAFKTSGLQKTVILELTDEIAATLNAACRIERSNALEALERELQREELESEKDAPAFTVPFSYYREELDAIGEQFELWRSGGQDIPEETLKRLRGLCALGAPEAQYYLGFYRLKKPEKVAHGQEYALKWLKKAARAGNADAAAALGDYYYDKGKKPSFKNSNDWECALAYYTGYGASALNERQRKAALDILRQREKKRRGLLWGAVWTALTWIWALTAALVMPSLPEKIMGPLYAACNVWLCLRFRASLRKRAYDGVADLPLSLLIALAAYLLVLLALSLILMLMGE